MGDAIVIMKKVNFPTLLREPELYSSVAPEVSFYHKVILIDTVTDIL
jgi:hypothetical protein